MKIAPSKNKFMFFLKERFIKAGLDAILAPPTKEVPFHHIKLDLESNRPNQPVFALIWLLSLPKTPSKGGENEGLFLQIFIPFPFHYVDQAFLSIARFLLMLNKVVAFPGFGLSEPEKGLYYKYTLCFPHGKLNEALVLDFLGAVQFLYDAHLSNIEKIASGQASLDVLIGHPA